MQTFYLIFRCLFCFSTQPLLHPSRPLFVSVFNCCLSLSVSLASVSLSLSLCVITPVSISSHLSSLSVLHLPRSCFFFFFFFHHSILVLWVFPGKQSFMLQPLTLSFCYPWVRFQITETECGKPNNQWVFTGLPHPTRQGKTLIFAISRYEILVSHTLRYEDPDIQVFRDTEFLL